MNRADGESNASSLRVLRSPETMCFGLSVCFALHTCRYYGLAHGSCRTCLNDKAHQLISKVTVVAFTLMGVEGIAAEIEQPFGT